MKTGIIFAAIAGLLIQPSVVSSETVTSVAAPDTSAVLPEIPYESLNLPTSPQVRSFYAAWKHAPIWFSGNTPKPEVTELLSMLRRAPLDGIDLGPQYAVQLESAVQQAASGNPQAISSAEHSLSEALVLYAQSMDRPIAGMIYGYDHLKPKGRSANDILRVAAGAPSLQAYLQEFANPNSVYTAIREAAWNQMQSAGSSTADPRVVANLDRARAMPAKGRFVMVNSATQMLYMYDNGVPVGSMKVVVGDYNRYIPRWMPTPLIASMMFYVIHNPYWNAPDFLVRKNIAPRYLAGGDKYFKFRGYKVMSDWTKEASVVPADQIDWKAVAAGKLSPRVRQDPGPSNFMGQLKFPFANPEGVYLHDTDPEDSKLFAFAERTRSNGCVRLENAPALARWLLGHDAVATSAEPELAEQVTGGVPVYLTYLTAVAENGQLTFLKDIYGWDRNRNGTQEVAGN